MKKRLLGLVLLGSFALVGTTVSNPMSIFRRFLSVRFDAFRRIHAVMHQKYAPLKEGEALPYYLSEVMLSTDCLETVQYLIDGGISVNTANHQGQTRLYTVHNTKLAQLLLDNGAFLNIKDCNGQTPLHTASSIEIARLFVDYGASVLIRDDQGRTPIDTARGNKDLAEFLSSHTSNEMCKE